MFEDIKKFSITARYFLIATFLMGLSNGMFDAVYNFYLEARGIDKTATGFIYAVAMSHGDHSRSGKTGLLAFL